MNILMYTPMNITMGIKFIYMNMFILIPMNIHIWKLPKRM